MRPHALAALLVLVGCTACDDRPDASPRSGAPSLADGSSYALIRASDGKTVTWDPVDYLGDACTKGLPHGSSYQLLFQACYSNPDTTVRTTPLDPSTKVIVWPRSNSKRTVGADQLAAEIGADADNDIPAAYRVWRIAVSDDRVVAVEQAVVRA